MTVKRFSLPIRIICCFLIFTLCLDLTSLTSQLIAADNAASKAADHLQKILPGMEAVRRDLPRDSFDAKAVVKNAGNDPAALFTWVRDETYLVPYRGVLRGSTGVLMDRLGNSLDRSLLLAELLQLAGHNARIAHGTLNNTQAGDLWSHLRALPANPYPKQEPSQQVDMQAAKYSGAFAMTPAEFKQNAIKSLKQEATVAQRIDEAVSRAQKQADSIKRSLEEAGQKMGDEKTVQLADLKDHWWVQLQEGQKWSDLDPATSDAKPGRALTSATETLAPDKIDSSLYHSIDIAVVVEQWKSNAFAETEVLRHRLQPSSLYGTKITFLNSPTHWPKGLNLLAESEPYKKLKETVLQQDEWAPVFNIGDQSIKDKGFTTSGSQAAVTDSASPAAGLWGKVANEMDKASGESKNEELTAEWIQYEIHSPGKEPVRIRREIFDLAGAAARSAKRFDIAKVTGEQRLQRGFDLLGQIEILPQTCWYSPYFLADQTLGNLIANQPVLIDTMRRVDSSDPASIQEGASQWKGMPGLLPVLALARHHFLRTNTFIAQPNLLTLISKPKLTSTGEIDLRYGFDILFNAVSTTNMNANAYWQRLQQGVMDTNLERILVAGCKPVENTSELYEARANENRWIQIKNLKQARHYVRSSQALFHIRDDLKNGFTILMPKKPIALAGHPSFGWWRVDPKTGDALGMMETGMGQAIVERVAEFVFLTWPFWLSFPLQFLGCAGTDFAQKGAAKNVSCLFCAILAALCWELSWLAALDIGFTMSCGFIAPYGIGAATATVCAIPSFAL